MQALLTAISTMDLTLDAYPPVLVLTITMDAEVQQLMDGIFVALGL